ncbi:MAG: pirin family protein [Hyphomicrobiaceae bacterium]
MRKIIGTYKAPRPHWVGDGFHVQSMISPQAHSNHLSPFIMLDYAAPKTFTPTKERRGVGQHPHKGFETVTIVYDGELEHRDSTGAGGTIGPGDVQWMTAANGILHEEFHSKAFAEKGGNMEMVQLWVNLPARDKGARPGYQTLLDKDIPVIGLPDGAAAVRVIAGSYGDRDGPARTFTPIDIWDVRLSRDKTTNLDLPEGRNVAVVVLDGTVEVNGNAIVRASEMIVLDRDGGAITIEANSDAKLLVLSGEPIDEPVAAYGPFVMNTEAELREAFADYHAGRFGNMAAAEATAH